MTYSLVLLTISTILAAGIILDGCSGFGILSFLTVSDNATLDSCLPVCLPVCL